MMRSAKWVESTISEPPKPRLMTGCSGKSCARGFQKRMVEEPMKRCAALVGGLVRSISSKAEISFSHLSKLWVACSAAVEGRVASSKTEKVNASELDFIRHILSSADAKKQTQWSTRQSMILMVEENGE